MKKPDKRLSLRLGAAALSVALLGTGAALAAGDWEAAFHSGRVPFIGLISLFLPQRPQASAAANGIRRQNLLFADYPFIST